MPDHVRGELIVIAVLMLLVAIFALWYVPASIDVPVGFGADSEVSPRFAPYLLSMIMVAAMIGRLIVLGATALRGKLDETETDITDGLGSAKETQRGIVLNLLTNVYAFLLIPVAGFYVASFALVGYLVHRLGENRLWMAGLIGVACAIFVYLLFERLLSVRLPDGALGDFIEQFGG